MKPRIALCFFIISIIMMYNDAFFNLFWKSIGIDFWRQLIWIGAIYFLFRYLRKKNLKISSIRKICHEYSILFIVILFFSVITMAINGFNITRIALAIFEYFFGVPFIIFPIVWISCGLSRRSLNRFFIIIGIFLSTGLILDYLSGGAISMIFNKSFDDIKFLSSNGRYTFLSTTDSIFTIYLTLCLLCCFFEYLATNSNKNRVFLLTLSLYFIFASIFCGARQTFAGLIIAEALCLYSVLRNNRSGILIIIIVFIIGFFLLPSAQNLLSNNEGFNSRYTTSAIKEDKRYKTWERGLDECILNPSPRRLLIGDGVGLTMEQHSNAGEKTGPHYENSFFARISEIGLVAGLFSILFPVFFIIKNRNKKANNILYIGFLATFIFISIVSPNGLTNQSQMTLFMILGLFIIENNCNPRTIINEFKK